MTMQIRNLAVAACLLAAPLCCAETPANASETPRIDLADLAWLEGCWDGTAFAKAATECWMRAPNGRLTGMFQLLDGEQQQFSEIFVLDHFEDGAELRLKHFHPNLHGWEERDQYLRFVLKETAPGLARFDGLLYQLEQDGSLRIELRMKRGEESFTERMLFRRR
jgi:hypothetical protein